MTVCDTRFRRNRWIGPAAILALGIVGVGGISSLGTDEKAAAQAVTAENPTSEHDAIRTAIEAVIREQEAAWNRGDVEAFVEHYWKSDDLTFSSGGKTTRGWAETLQGYRKRYPTPEKMGRVAFSRLEITLLGDAAAMVLGEWRLERASDPVGGNFTLVFRKLDGRWVIVHDHTSRLTE
jgi:beta-aspartyl-peptidase (threonine type)